MDKDHTSNINLNTILLLRCTHYR